uniref:TNF receptor superfamily member 6b n=1 Tax=Nothoprocta perdicaria TaxID=30464 RepID=A0A8C6ZCU3_NOTPE
PAALTGPGMIKQLPLGAAFPPTYQWKDAVTEARVTCQQCPPGTFVAQHCSSARPTLCAPCPELHYTQYWNYLEKCRYCNVICEEQQVEVQQCNATHNRVCQCRQGYFAENEFCVRHSECAPGSGVASAGTPVEDTRCQPCPRGSFSASASRSEPCRPHQDCARQGKVTNVPGNQYHDTLCTSSGCPLQDAVAGYEDCAQAAIDFVAYQDIPVRKLRRLQQLLEHSPRRAVPAGRAAAQEKFRRDLTRLKEGHPEVTRELLGALRAAKLHAIERQVRERFLGPARLG